MNDKLILSLAKKMKIPLVTFDEELRKECVMEGVKNFIEIILIYFSISSTSL